MVLVKPDDGSTVELKLVALATIGLPKIQVNHLLYIGKPEAVHIEK